MKLQLDPTHRVDRNRVHNLISRYSRTKSRATSFCAQNDETERGEDARQYLLIHVHTYTLPRLLSLLFPSHSLDMLKYTSEPFVSMDLARNNLHAYSYDTLLGCKRDQDNRQRNETKSQIRFAGAASAFVSTGVKAIEGNLGVAA